jgi:hypothetical protein
LFRFVPSGLPNHEGLAQQSAPEPGDREGKPRKWGVYEPGDAGAEICVQGVGVFWEKLKAQSIELFTKVKKNMKEKIITPMQNFYLSKRGLIETVNDQLKNICQIEHTRHRKPANAFVNLVAGLIAYTFKQRKPSIKNDKLRKPMAALTPN